MHLLGASLALAGATACSTRPVDERILPYTKTPPSSSRATRSTTRPA
ncbi:hypothetical protein QEG98_33405 [Myxococcus sp. MxC21-1]|nr:hypothetical protein [Myxococcus sp. MxC21-1]WNZ60793.1 hypothetical protein QEG98_33405 [Myxococcus sp. MxC21-1]